MTSHSPALEDLTAPPERIIGQVELSGMTGLSVTTIWRMRRRGELPDPIQLSPGRVGWPAGVIRGWLQSRRAAGSRR